MGTSGMGTSGMGSNDMAGEQRLTLSEEQLSISKRQTQAGEVELRKTVETEHVSQPVSLSHEEVTVERRPISGEMSGAQIGEQEISVQLTREEAVVDKRAVPREEIIVRKNQVTDNKTVEADLRRERLDVDRSGAAGLSGNDSMRGAAYNSGGTLGNSAERGTRGLGDRIADAADDVKDSVDGNPASRPGRDATDRPGR
jgi:uncharacterized protein (TIGR02271 family)